MFVPLRPSESAVTTLSTMDETERDILVRNCVHAMIILGQRRMPIKKSDLNRLAFASRTPRQVNAVIELANRELNKIFGMRLYEVNEKSSTKYLLVNSTPDFGKYITNSDKECIEFTVLYFTLMDIITSPDSKVAETDITNSLQPLGVPTEMLKVYFDSLVGRLYLTTEKTQETKYYLWGPRAVAEVEGEKFFNQFMEMVGDSTGNGWPEVKQRLSSLNLL